MNNISLLGYLALPPTYHCTKDAQDLTRFELRTKSSAYPDEPATAHHCLAWGPAALDLHQHLKVGDQLMVRGELLYRRRKLRAGGVVRVPVIHVSGYTYLGKKAGTIALKEAPQSESELVTS